MERENWREHINSNSNGNYYDRFVCDYDNGERSPAKPSSPPRLGYIEHHVSKFDTLAGVAIKYGVEVADIRKMNSLVTDHQMFALKTLHIPLPARHPPSPYLSNGSSTPGSLVNVILEEIMEKSDDALAAETREVGSNKWNDKLGLRHQKSVADFIRIPELLLREDNSSSGVLPSRTGKGLALRQKAANRTTATTDSEPIGLNPAALGMGDASLIDGSSGVRKSSSTSCLQDQDNSGSSSIWPTKMWNLKPDLQALSTAAIGKPIFDGFPKPITGRKNKAALD
ncbi:hypothetical protein JHK85_027046 [Glycine max]|nr:hypothetical protein JHK85_027046 [Glycine max]KAG5014294.1 hypothetical protein JHK86_026555 [Glycine max]